MKAIKYFAEEAFGAWAKTGYLFENGIFLCEFEYYREPKYICRKYDFHNPPDKTTWGKDVIDHLSSSPNPGAFSDYQTFVKQKTIDKDFDQMKNSLINRKVPFWKENHHTSQNLENL